jgi:hypothetical protein
MGFAYPFLFGTARQEEKRMIVERVPSGGAKVEDILQAPGVVSLRVLVGGPAPQGYIWHADAAVSPSPADLARPSAGAAPAAAGRDTCALDALFARGF